MEGKSMKRSFLLSSLAVLTLLISGFTFPGAGSAPVEEIEHPDNGVVDDVTPPEAAEEVMEDYVLLDDLIDMGYAKEFVTDIDNVPTEVGWFGPRTLSPPMAPGAAKDENDGPGNATEMTDGSTYSDNVTSWIASNTINFNDLDWFYFNLTANPTISTADRITIEIESQDAVDQEAPLIAEFGTFFMGQLFGSQASFDVMDFEATGGKDRNVSTIECTVEAGGTYFLRVLTYNDTTTNYTIDVDIQSVTVTNTEWNALWPSGTFVNSTQTPSRMQVVDQANDTWDWFNLDGLIDDAGLDQDRGDAVRMGFRIEEATAFKGRQNAYLQPSMYGNVYNTCAITWVWVIYNNYTEQAQGVPSLHLVLLSQQNGLPYFISSVFGTGSGAAISQNVIFQDQIDIAWIGVNPAQLWYNDAPYNMFGCDNGAHVQYNITNLNVDLLPPNNPPRLTQQIPDQSLDEDTGPWNVTDLMEHFSDDDTITPLEFIVSKPSGVTNPDELQVKVVDGRYLWVNVTKANWHGSGEYRIRCMDYGVEDRTISVDDREKVSNTFEVVINPVNDPAYIEKVSTLGGDRFNNHMPIEIIISQGNTMFRSKKVFGRDNDTEDQDRLVYTHNATTTAFSMNKNGQIDFVPTNDDVGSTLIRIWVDDQRGDDEDDYVDLLFKVTNSNDPPTLTKIEWPDGARSYDLTMGENTPTFKNVREDYELNLTVTASDPDILIGQPDVLTWHVEANGWKAYPHPTDPLKAYVTYTPTNDDAITSMVETSLYCMDIANDQSQSDMTVRLMIENTNDAPEILTVNNEEPFMQGGVKRVELTQETGIYAMEDELFTIQVSAIDIDPRDSVTFEALDPAFQKFEDPFDPFSMNFTIRPSQDMVGFHTVLIKVTDEDDETDTVSVYFEVVNTNDPPEETFDIDWETSVELIVGNNITFFVEDLSDPDEDELTVSWDFGDNTAVVQGETVTHSFANDQSYIITVTVSDPSGEKVQKTRTITIYPYVPPEPDPDQDSDSDGMPDVYEDDNGLNKNVDDADLDNDRDGYTNYEEYLAGTSPINENDKPVEVETEDEGIDTLLIIIAVVVIGILAASGFFIFALSRKPKPVAQQQAYAPEGPGLPGSQTQQLPQGGAPGLPPGPQAQGEMGTSQEIQNLPPADEPEKEEEDDLMDSFLEDAAKQLEEDQEPNEGEDNVWRPPAEPEEEHESQVDDLFADAPEETGAEETADAEAEPEEEQEPPKKSSIAGPPPPPLP